MAVHCKHLANDEMGDFNTTQVDSKGNFWLACGS